MKNAAKRPARRMGPEGSATWIQILDGVEDILREEGYASLTSRRVAERAGVKQQLVYYYFANMDDLAVEAFRRLSRREIERLETALGSERPLHEIWNVCIHTADSRLIAEFMALANRNADTQEEVIHFIERSRQLQAKAISRTMKASRRFANMSPAALAFLATSVALALTRETALGISRGHRDVERLIAQCLGEMEPS